MVEAVLKRLVLRNATALFSICVSVAICQAQDLRPRAYLITPSGRNAAS